MASRPAASWSSTPLARRRLGFGRMNFLDLSVEESTRSGCLPERIDVVTALHACNTATDDAIQFALAKRGAVRGAGALLPGRGGQRAAQNKNASFGLTPLSEIWRHPSTPASSAASSPTPCAACSSKPTATSSR